MKNTCTGVYFLTKLQIDSLQRYQKMHVKFAGICNLSIFLDILGTPVFQNSFQWALLTIARFPKNSFPQKLHTLDRKLGTKKTQDV